MALNAGELFLREVGTGRIRMTRTGRERYARRFVQVGYRPEAIRSLPELEAAVDAMFQREMAGHAVESRGTDPALDRILEGLPGWEP